MGIQALNQDELLQLLNNLNIDYRYIEHPAMNSVGDRGRYAVRLPAQLLKNMLLKNSNGRHFYLYILDGEKRADLKALAREMGDSRLSTLFYCTHAFQQVGDVAGHCG